MSTNADRTHYCFTSCTFQFGGKNQVLFNLKPHHTTPHHTTPHHTTPQQQHSTARTTELKFG
jgi:hypothetical protein